MFVSWHCSLGQAFRETGSPFITNFNSVEYKAHAQNFVSATDPHGLLYVGNFAGVLQYDGEKWRLIPTSNITKVSALAVDDQGTVFVGARGEIGKLVPDSKGELYFNSLIEDSLSILPQFQEVIQIVIQKNKVLFFIREGVISLQDNKIEFKKTDSDILAAFSVSNKVFVQLKNKGLLKWQDATVDFLKSDLLQSDATLITSILQLDDLSLLVATNSMGLLRLRNDELSVFDSEANDLLIANPVSCGVRLSDGTLALGTTRRGIMRINQDGEIIQWIDKDASLQNSFVKHLLAVDGNGLYAALNNGISFVELPSPFSFFNDQAGLEGAVNDIIRHQGTLYVATYQGLFFFDSAARKFFAVKEINTACQSVVSSSQGLVAATSQGVFLIQKSAARLIQPCFALTVEAVPGKENAYYVGETKGLYLLEFTGGQWKYQLLGMLNEEVGKLLSNDPEVLWGLSISKGLFIYEAKRNTLSFPAQENDFGIGTGLSIASIGNEIVVINQNGLHKYDRELQKFIPYSFQIEKDTVNQTWFSIMKEDKQQRIWTTHGDETNLNLFVKSTTAYESQELIFKPIAKTVIRCIYPEENDITWFGGPDGLIRYDNQVKNTNLKTYPSLIRSVYVNGDSVVFGGHGDPDAYNWVFSHKDNNLLIHFSSPYHAVNKELTYQVYLEGFDAGWSDWVSQSSKEYTNLPGGDFRFHVRSKNIFEQTSAPESISIKVLSPWYQTVWAYVFYVFLLGGLMYLFMLFRNRKLLREKRVLEERITARTAEVVKQKEEIVQQSHELAEKNEELEKINAAIKSINAEINVDNLLQSLLERLRIIRTAEKSAALVLDKNADMLRLKAGVGYDPAEFPQLMLSVTDAENRYLKHAEEVFEDVFIKNDFRSFDLIPEMSHFARPKSMMVLLIRIETKIEAFLIFENFSRDHAFVNRDISLIRNAKEHIISALIRTRILDDLQLTLHNLKDTQEQLIQSEKLASLGQLTAGIAHEIQNPLNFVNNFASLSADLALELQELLQTMKENISADQFDEADEVIGMIRQNVTKINEHGKRVESIVKGMLQHSRGKTGDFELVELNNLVNEYVSLAFHGMRAKDKTFNTSIVTLLDPQLGKVSLIPQDLSRVILNIANNAFYAVDEKVRKNIPGYKPEVVISTRKQGTKVEISIRDNGTGIPPQVVEKIFNPFFTTKPTGKGTGLGLSMSFDIISKLHKGKLEVKTEVGEFTEFLITIPEKQS